MYRIKGDLALKKGLFSAEEAEENFLTAIKIAKHIDAKWWELRATNSPARLLRDSGRRDDARAMLAEIYNWFTEGFYTADLKDAKDFARPTERVAGSVCPRLIILRLGQRSRFGLVEPFFRSLVAQNRETLTKGSSAR